MARRPVDPQQSFPALEQRGPRALARARRLPRVDPPPRGRRAVGLLGGPADRQRPPGLPPRPRARVQGHLPALQDDARLLRRAQGRLGLPRARGRDRRPAAAGHGEQARDRDLRDRRVQPALPRVGLRVPRGLERADRAHRVLDRPRRRLPHARRDLHRVRLVGAAPAARQGPALRGLQGRALLHGVRHRAVQPRGGAGLSRRSSTRASTSACPSSRTAVRCRPATSCSSGRRRPGRWSPTRRSRSTPSSPTCARRRGRWTRRSCSPRRWWNACSAPTACGSSTASPARRSTACATSRPSPSSRPTPTASAATPSCSPTSSPPTTAPASCTPRSPSARTTSASARSTG